MKQELPNIKRQPRLPGERIKKILSGAPAVIILLVWFVQVAEVKAQSTSNIREFEIKFEGNPVISGRPYALDGFGSGFALRSVKGDGELNFLSVRDGKAPTLANIKFKNNIFEFSEALPILDQHGQTPDFDVEGIAIENKDYAWICEEKLPSAHKLDLKTGKIINSLLPGKELPSWLSNRDNNNGFEGIAFTPSGKLILALQRGLKINGEKTRFIPLIKYDLKSNQYQVYAYSYQAELYRTPESVKIADIYALDDQRLLVLEQGKSDNNDYQTRVYITYLEEELIITDDRFENFVAPEQPKVLVLDLAEIGWVPRKVEGLTIMPDDRSLVISSEISNDDKSMRIWFIKLPKRIAAFKPHRYMLVISMLMPLVLILIALLFRQFRVRKKDHAK